MTAPAWLSTADDDELLDLSAIGVELQRPLDEPQIDALASDYLRRMGAIERDVRRYELARDQEIDRVSDRYERRLKPLREALAAFRNAVCELARRVQFPGKAKSRTVGYGRYGRRIRKGGLKVVDAQTALTWAIETDPSAVRATVQVTLSEWRRLVGAHPELGEVAPKLDVGVTALKELRARCLSLGDNPPPGCELALDVDEPFAETTE